MNPDDLIALNEEIAGMARAGLPLDQGLAALAREMGKGRLQQVTATLARDLQAGHTLPQALERQAGRVPPFYAGLVAAGVRTGRISEVLATLTVYARALANLRATIVDAFFYPVVVLVFAFGLFGFLCLVVLPQFEQIFSDFGMSLPALTQGVLAVGRQPMQLVIVPVLVLLAALFLVRLVLRSTAAGRSLWARVVYAVPVVGTLIRAARLAAFTELLAILVDHETPLPEAFRLAGEASSDPIMAAAAQEVHEGLSQGLALGAVLKGRGLVPEWVSWMAGLGEHRGTLGPTLHRIAELYRRQVETRAALLRSILPPFLILVTAGLFTVFFVLAMMLPMIKLLEGLSK
jgi:type II secretory pathway component PulF